MNRHPLIAAVWILVLSHARGTADEGKRASVDGPVPMAMPGRGARTASPKPTPDPVSGLVPLPASLPLLKMSKEGLAAVGKPVSLEALVKEGASYSPGQHKAAIYRQVLERSGKDLLSIRPQADASKVPQYFLLGPAFDGEVSDQKRFEGIGKCLLVAHYLLSRSEPGWKMRGAFLAFEQTLGLDYEGKDALLTVAICDAFVLPYLDLFPVKDETALEIPGLERSFPWEHQNVVWSLAGQYRMAKAPLAKSVRLFKLFLETAKLSDPVMANRARVQLSKLAEEAGDYEGAIAYLREQDPKGTVVPCEEQIAALQEKLRNRSTPNAPQ